MMLIERCVTKLSEAKQAILEGADRLELCENLEVDGLTPSKKNYLKVKKETKIPIYVMLREVEKGFSESQKQIESLIKKAIWFKKNDADGFVFGFCENKKVDAESCQRLIEVCKPLPCTFHKAFDTCEDLKESLETIIELGFDAILTSGGAFKAEEGIEVIKSLSEVAKNRINLIVGGKVRPQIIKFIHKKTGVKNFHFRV